MTQAIESVVDLIELGAIAPEDIVKCLRSALTETRQWQGLTNDEVKGPIQRAMQYFGFDTTQYSLGGAATIGFLGLVKEIEAKLKEKNT